MRRRHLAGTAVDTVASPSRRILLRWAGWYGVANATVVGLVSLRNLAVTDAPHGLLAWAFAVLMFVGQAALLGFIPTLVLLPVILVRPRRPVVMTVATVAGVALVGTVLIDTVVFQQYRFHLNAEVFNLLFGGAAGEILVFSAAMYVQTALALSVILLGETLLARWLWNRVRSRAGGRWGAGLASALVAAFLAQAGIHAWADVAGYTPVTRQSRVLLAYVPVTAESLFRRLGLDIERADAALLAGDHGTNLAYPLHPLRCARAGSPPNILFVVIDGWRADAFDEAVTPNIARIAGRSLRFTDHLSGGSATRTGIFSLFYAIPGTYWHAMLAERRGPVFIDELYRQGYEVSIFAAAKLLNPEFHDTVFADVENLRLQSDGDTPSARDIDLTGDFLEFLERRKGDRPFFSMLFYDAPHGYDIPEDYPRRFEPSWDKVNYLTLNNDTDPEPFHNLYRNCVGFDDDLVGRVFDTLEQKGLVDDTVIVITGDHGQEFNENRLNYWGHDSNFSRYQVAVPLVVFWPGFEPATYGHRTSHYDIVPTLMQELFDCSNDPADYSVGHHLMRPGGRDMLLLANYTDYAVVQPDRVVAVYPYGVEILDVHYRRIPGATLDKAVMLEALRQRGRFYH